MLDKPEKCKICPNTDLEFIEKHFHGDLDSECDDVWMCKSCGCIHGSNFFEFSPQGIKRGTGIKGWKLNEKERK